MHYSVLEQAELLDQYLALEKIVASLQERDEKTAESLRGIMDWIYRHLSSAQHIYLDAR